MTVFSYQLPDATIPVLLSSDTAELLRAEAAALRAYAATHPGATAQEIAGCCSGPGWRVHTGRWS